MGMVPDFGMMYAGLPFYRRIYTPDKCLQLMPAPLFLRDRQS